MENSPPMTVSTASGEASPSSSGNQIHAAPLKKKRNLPGMPDPDAEVISLSPTTLMATNRFVCEICNKGFQRDQNLQLHRRGHNLPWKLRQRTGKEIRKRVYVCPEPTCVHHNPARALGDLTGIKKHFCRKHGEKKWKCERCSKKYAVQSDWKAHMKTCGTREYKCDCGTIFSRRDSFVTHRAFCDALAEESARAQTAPVRTGGGGKKGNGNTNTVTAVVSPPPPPSSDVLIQCSGIPDDTVVVPPPMTTPPSASAATSSSSVFASIFAVNQQSSKMPPPPPPPIIEGASLSLSTPLYISSNGSTLFPATDNDHCHYSHPQPAMSATALLQKAAQIGATASNQSFLRGLGLEPPSASPSSANIKLESNSMSTDNHHLGLGLSPGFSDSMFVNKPTTLDLLGLGIAGGDSSTTGLSALFNSFGNGGFPTTSYGDVGGNSAAGFR